MSISGGTCCSISSCMVGNSANRTILTPEVLADVIAYIQSNCENRLKDYAEIVHDMGIICKPATLRRVGMNCAVAITKPFLTLDIKGKWMAFCRFVSEWDILDWCRVIFYDEAGETRFSSLVSQTKSILIIASVRNSRRPRRS
jgi:hypothetical protein